MSSTAVLESKGAQLARALEKQKVALSTANSAVSRTEKELSVRREQFQAEVRRALRALDNKREEVRFGVKSEGEKRALTSHVFRLQRATSESLSHEKVQDARGDGQEGARAPSNPEYHLQLLSQLKRDVKATESTLVSQKASAREISRSVNKTEEQCSLVQSMVTKLKSTARIQKESVSQEEAISMALARLAVSRTFGGVTSTSTSSQGGRRVAASAVTGGASYSLEDGALGGLSVAGKSKASGDTGQISSHREGVVSTTGQSRGDEGDTERGELHGEGGAPSISPPPLTATNISTSTGEGSSWSKAHSSAASIEGVGVVRNSEGTALSLQCDVASVGGVQLKLAAKDGGGVSVSMSVSDPAMVPALMREKAALLSKLRDSGHDVSDISVGVGGGSASATWGASSIGSYLSNKAISATHNKGDDDELTIS